MGLLTTAKINSAIKTVVDGSDTNLSDGGGLSLRIRQERGPLWVYRFRRPSDKKQAKISLGTYPAVSLKEARESAERFRKELESGRDPQMVKSAAYEKNAAALSMQQLLEAWLKSVKVTKSISVQTIGEHEWRWECHLKKTLGNLAATEINRAQIANALDTMRSQNIREQTRKALTTINKVLEFGVSRHLIESNPARMLKPSDFGATTSKARKRFLPIEELSLFWKALDVSTHGRPDISKGATLSGVQAAALKLLIVTGARRGEVAEMEWSEVDLDKCIWTLPPERTKNGEGHTVYLSGLAVSILKDMQAWSKGRKYVFQSERKIEDGPIHRDSLTQIVLRMTGQKKTEDQTQRGYVAPLEHIKAFTVHDLRRSAATIWGETLKVWPHVIEKMLNHQPQNKLVGTYQRAAYVDEQRKAWNDWGKYLDRMLNGDLSNVVEFPQPVKA